MKAAFLEKPNSIQIRDISIPEPAIGEIRVKLSQIGICGSDVHLFLGHRKLNQPTIIGHEGLGIIDKLGEGVTERTIGARVVIEPNIPCRKCIHCMRGNSSICPNKRTIGLNSPGCFAEYVCVPESFCWSVPAEISDENAVVIEPLAVGVHALFKSNVKPGDSIAVIGLGAIGMLLMDLALSLGYRVFVTEINPQKIETAIKLGAIHTKGPAEELNTIWEKEQVMAVFECGGSAKTVTLATEAAPRGSEIILVGLSEQLAQFQPLKIVREGITLVPSIIYEHPADFRRAIHLIKSGIIQPGKFISNQFNLDNLQTALELASQGSETKIIIKV